WDLLTVHIVESAFVLAGLGTLAVSLRPRGARCGAPGTPRASPPPRPPACRPRTSPSSCGRRTAPSRASPCSSRSRSSSTARSTSSGRSRGRGPTPRRSRRCPPPSSSSSPSRTGSCGGGTPVAVEELPELVTVVLLACVLAVFLYSLPPRRREGG